VFGLRYCDQRGAIVTGLFLAKGGAVLDRGDFRQSWALAVVSDDFDHKPIRPGMVAHFCVAIVPNIYALCRRNVDQGVVIRGWGFTLGAAWPILYAWC
jgi:hypothetical protein